jgi:hypothetical protein
MNEDISYEQNKVACTWAAVHRRYVLELAEMLVELNRDSAAFTQCLKDLKTAVVFMKASEHER